MKDEAERVTEGLCLVETGHVIPDVNIVLFQHPAVLQSPLGGLEARSREGKKPGVCNSVQVQEENLSGRNDRHAAGPTTHARTKRSNDETKEAQSRLALTPR